jgi:glycosyltransferase involved in cell wall biosynthesis
LSAPSITAVLPAFNEEEALPRTVAELATALDRVAPDWEIVIVDDGSRDGTAAACDRLEREMAGRFRFVRFPENRGYGAALAAGISASRKDLVFFTDSDGQFDPAQIGLLVERLGGGAAVIGYRIARAEGARRHFVSGVFNRIARVVFGIRCRDVDCAFKLIRGDVVRRLPLSCRRYLVNTELLYHLRRAGVTPAEVPVHHRARLGGSTKIGFSDVPRTLLEIAKLRVRLWRGTSAPRAAAGASAAPGGSAK